MDAQVIRRRADELLAGMTLTQKIGQITQLYYDGTNFEEMQEIIRTVQPGSLIVCGSALAGNEEQMPICRERLDALQNTAVEENGIPILFGRDVIHGHRVVLPVPLTMSAAFDPALVQEGYDAIRQEAVYEGIKWTFAPMVDLSRDPRWGRTIEGPGEDPYVGEQMAAAIVRGFQTEDLSDEQAMAACAKHFVGYGASEGGRDYNHTEIGDYLLQNTYLPAFRSAVRAGVATVMAGFNDVNGIPLSGNRRLVTEVLRHQLHFDGFVVSDWDAIRQMMAYSGFAADKKDAARLALQAGVDMDMADRCYLENMEALVSQGTISTEELDEAVRRILSVKLRMGLLEHPNNRPVAYDTQAHLALAQRLAEESIVLLKNEKQLLPLDKQAAIGFAGPYLHNKTELVGSWALDTDYRLVSSPAEAIRAIAPGAQLSDPQKDAYLQVPWLRDCQALVLMLGESRQVTGEAHCLAEPTLPAEQLDMARKARRLGIPVVGVFCFARPLVLGEEESLFDAILYAGHGGTRAAEAIAAVLYGDAEPGGRLPFTIPRSVGQIPLYCNAQPGARQINGYYNDENPYHRNYLDCSGSPTYPFGYGLSYTDFRFSDPEVSHSRLSAQAVREGARFTLRCTVENVGDRPGGTVLQLYVRDVLASRMRPLRALRDFTKVQLRPGERRTVELSVGYEDLGFFLEDGAFILEPGEFILYCGTDCTTVNSVTVTVEAD